MESKLEIKICSFNKKILKKDNHWFKSFQTIIYINQNTHSVQITLEK
jgi:hypothetical protein